MIVTAPPFDGRIIAKTACSEGFRTLEKTRTIDINLETIERFCSFIS